MDSQKLQHPPILTLSSLLQIPYLKDIKVCELPSQSQETLYSTIINIINEVSPLDPLYIMDLGMLITLYHSWVQTLPMVKPFFAVRCNPDPVLLATLSALGSSFECASSAEISRVLALSVSPDRILFSNPCKIDDHIKYAARVGVSMLVFDSVDELEKVRKFHPRCSLLLHVHVPLGNTGEASRLASTRKCGALDHEVTALLKHAQQLRLDVVGVSLDSEGCVSRSNAHAAAIQVLRDTFQAFSLLGLPRPRVVNVGGGFDSGAGFAKEAAALREMLQAKFPELSSISVIGTPGRFLAEKVSTLVTHVIGKRVRGNVREYWINDGVYGSMNAVIYHQKDVHPVPLACGSRRSNPSCKGLPTFRSTVFGPTCDALDTVFTDRQLPELSVGDWLVFPNMGAYSQASATNFNGFSASNIHTNYVFSKPCSSTKA